MKKITRYLYMSNGERKVSQADLYDPVQHNSKANADDPRKEVADDRGDPSIVTGQLRHHLDNVWCVSAILSSIAGKY